MWYKWTYLRNRNRFTDIENRLVVAKREGGGGEMNWEFEISRCKLLYIYREREIKLNDFAVHQKLTQHCKSTILQSNKF